MISFNTIPADIRTPGQHIEFDSSRAVSGLPPIENRVLLIGQMLATGSADALTLQPVVEPNQAVGLFGRGSMLARMAAAYKNVDRYSEVVAIGLDDAEGATAATSTLTVTGPATAAGDIALMIAGVRIPVTVANAAAAVTIAAAIAAAVTAAADLPVTAAVGDAPNDHVVTLTARNKGAAGNEIDVRHSHYAGEALPAGVGLAIVGMAGGAGDPDVDDVWAVIGDQPFRTMVFGLIDAATAAKIKAELDDRWGEARMLESVAYCAKPGTQGTLAAFGAALNSELLTILGTGLSPSWPAEAAAIYGAVCGYYTAIDPARPTQTLQLTGLVAPRVEDQFTGAQREALLHDGIATFAPDTSGTCRIERSITTYQTDAFGLEDVAWLDLETVTTLGYLRASLRTRIAQKFPRMKLADDGTRFGAGQAIVTPKIIRAEIIALFREWEDAGLVENLDQFITDLIVERSTTDVNRVNALVPPDIVNQFRSFAAAIQFRL
ncbi:phage tail sheath C-terminal domain-containing protein [Novosphingobium naphthalenivorans]|uniref:phage tail sheath C-terminal domain-containing protein n=1 Tax=Novosphingobium naphthalenivorans TaxID=273168 RepID=UPI0008346DB2|nr:phage tail sheath C-terminal domain-containing protein [Novosphingobium naphthalenivorans]